MTLLIQLNHFWPRLTIVHSLLVAVVSYNCQQVFAIKFSTFCVNKGIAQIFNK